MPSTTSGRGLERSLSWPPLIRINRETYKGDSGRMFAQDTDKQSNGLYQDEFDEYPDRIFSSPVRMYEYEDWASDSDDDDDEVEWDAGITDFALFDSERRQARQNNEHLSSRWNDMMQNQNAALKRSVQRERANSMPSHGTGPQTTVEDVPGLTPDHSPDLRDDLDVESYHGQMVPRPKIPKYFTYEIAPSNERQEVESRHERDHGRPSTVNRNRSEKSASPSIRRHQRPGLGHTRTMSGHLHAWRKPDRKMYTVGEDPQAESAEDECSIRRVDSAASSNLGRGRSDR